VPFAPALCALASELQWDEDGWTGPFYLWRWMNLSVTVTDWIIG